MKIQIHKNAIKRFLVKPGAYILGREPMVRWVDVPELMEVETVSTRDKQSKLK